MTTEQDPHKHALYRPHHGDMTGWRYLESGERILKGDQFLYGEGEWVETYLSNEPLDDGSVGYFRRRVTAESKPVEQKRYMTAVIEADEESLEWVAGELHSKGVKVISFREGNALTLLDGLEERVVKAIREGV